jgi:predicted site-specific integrase-resolvase
VMPNELGYTLAEIAEQFAVDPRTVRRWVSAGLLPAVEVFEVNPERPDWKPQRRKRVPAEAVERLL